MSNFENLLIPSPEEHFKRLLVEASNSSPEEYDARDRLCWLFASAMIIQNIEHDEWSIENYE